MDSFLAIDPGIHTGWARLDDSLGLVKCGIGAPDDYPYRAVLIEKPTVYPRSEVDPNNLITLAWGAGRYDFQFSQLGSIVLKVEPRTWKGSIDKKKHHPIVWSACSPREQDVVSQCGRGISDKKLEDMMDAVGLAQYARKMHIFKN